MGFTTIGGGYGIKSLQNITFVVSFISKRISLVPNKAGYSKFHIIPQTKNTTNVGFDD